MFLQSLLNLFLDIPMPPPTPTPVPGGPAAPGGIYPFILIGAVIVIAAVILVMVLKNRKNSGTEK